MLILCGAFTHTHSYAANCAYTCRHSHMYAPLQDYPSQPAPLHAHLWMHLHPHRDFDFPTCTHLHKHLHTLLGPSFLPVCVPGRKSHLCEAHSQVLLHPRMSCCHHSHDAQPTVSLVCPSHTLTLVPLCPSPLTAEHTLSHLPVLAPVCCSALPPSRIACVCVLRLFWCLHCCHCGTL